MLDVFFTYIYLRCYNILAIILASIMKNMKMLARKSLRKCGNGKRGPKFLHAGLQYSSRFSLDGWTEGQTTNKFPFGTIRFRYCIKRLAW